ncbi:MAG: flagellar hook-associated protein FlgK [Pirellulales bacterium]|nr:flagellar hook-associated protein FlgK [Pirellulales bacterium]
MSLFGSIQLGGNTLQAMQIGLQVVGNNIANAGTPGFVREEAVYVPAPVQRQGGLVLGLGVKVDSIVQKLDKFVLSRLVGARGDRAGAEVQEDNYRELESLLNELDDTEDLSNALTTFFNAVDEVLKAPGNAATRSLAVGKGISLASNINNLYNRANDLRNELNDRVYNAADEINSLTEEIQRLNIQIATAEGGDSSGSEAGGLRVLRQASIDRLSEIIGISVTEQPSGGVSITAGGELLVFEGQRRTVHASEASTDGVASGLVEYDGTNSPVSATSGELYGLYEARDEATGSFLSRLDDLAATLAFEFNKLYSQGQGLVGFDSLTSIEAVSDPVVALDEVGLAFTPVNGSFDLLVRSKENNLTHTVTIRVDLNGLDDDTTLNDLATQIDAVDGIRASVSATGQLQIVADSTDIDFGFSNDTSGTLAALGLNTFFTGSTAASLGVNDELKGITNAGKFAASLDGIGGGSGNAERLAAFLTTSLDAAGGATLADLYTQLINEVTQGSTVSQAVADGFRSFEGALESQAQAASGVSVDEEAIKMMTLQRIFQASAKYIQTISELLDLLVNL